VHVSDLHVSVHSERGRDEESNSKEILRNTIDLINKLEPQPQFVVFSGDLADSGDVESYEYIKSVISTSKSPVICALGNHDNRSNFRKVFYDSLSGHPYFYISKHGDINVIVLDTNQPGKVSGNICAEQFNFLQDAVLESEEVRKILVLHHPPRIDKDGLSWTTLNESTSYRLAGILEGRKILGILCGHIHLNQFTNWNNIPLISSSGIQSTIDAFEHKELRLLKEASLNLCKLTGEHLSVTCLRINPQGKELRRINKKRLISLA